MAVIALRRRTRETLRHERAVVLQQLGADAAEAHTDADLAFNQARAAELRRWAKTRSTGVKAGPSQDHLPAKDAQQNRSQHDGASMPAGVPAPVEPSLSVTRGGEPDDAHLGVVTSDSVAGGNGSTGSPACTYCNDQAGGCWFCGRG